MSLTEFAPRTRRVISAYNMDNTIKRTHYNFLKKYMKTSLDNIEYVNGIPKVVYILWFSHTDQTPAFTIRRFNALTSLINGLQVPVIIITSENYKCFEKKEFPYHEAFKYLSGVHKSDYLRSYLLHHYGGGYHDIKFRENSWENEWDKLSDPNIWILGRQEFYEDAVGYPPGQEHLKKEFAKMATMGWIICRPHTDYTRELSESIAKILDNCLAKLKENPATRARFPEHTDTDTKYPLRWLEIMGEISHPLMLKYHEHMMFGLPDVLYKTYK